MRCSKAKKWINDYLDGILEKEKEINLKNHLNSCQDCRSFLGELEEILQEARGLKVMHPSPHLWSRIVSGVEEKAQQAERVKFSREKLLPSLLSQKNLRYVFVSAGVLVLCGVVLFLSYRPLKEKNILPMSDPQAYALAKLKEAELNYRQAFDSLSKVAFSAQSELDPEIIEVFRKNLALISSSIHNLEKEMREDSSNLELYDHLLFVYGEKLDLLHKIISTKSAYSRGEDSNKFL